jgi:hypothetical protein
MLSSRFDVRLEGGFVEFGESRFGLIVVGCSSLECRLLR